MREPPPPAATRSEMIDSWKGIAAYLGKDVSTVMRWERSRGLPVHRLPGGRKATIYALAAELDAWRRGASEPAVPTPPAEARQGNAPAPSIAVLPFDNLSAEKENEYFSHGLADGIITALSRGKTLRVIARTSSFALHGRDQGVGQIGKVLGVGTLLVGSVQRAGGRARVSVQLVDCSDGRSMWADRYDCDLGAPFDVQDEIAERIAAALQMTLGDRPSPRPPAPEAYRLWLEGRYRQLNGRTLQDFASARECYAKAIAADPTFGLAHLALSQQALQAAGFGLASPLAVRATILSGIERALAWDSRLGEAHAARARYLALYEFDWNGAEESFARAFECEPGSAAALREVSAWLLTPVGRLEEAELAARRAVELDPLSPVTRFVLAQLLFCRRDYDGCIAGARTALELGGGIPMLEWMIGMVSALQGRFDEAIAACASASARIGSTPMLTGAMGMVQGWAGRPAEARRTLVQLDALASRAYVSPIHRAWVHIGLGESDAAFEWLDRAIDARDPHVLYLPVKPHYDALRRDARLGVLMSKLRLPAAASTGRRVPIGELRPAG